MNSRSILPPSANSRKGKGWADAHKSCFPGALRSVSLQISRSSDLDTEVLAENMKMRIPLVVLLICLNGVFGDDYDYQEQRLFIPRLNLSFCNSENVQIKI